MTLFNGEDDYRRRIAETPGSLLEVSNQFGVARETVRLWRIKFGIVAVTPVGKRPYKKRLAKPKPEPVGVVLPTDYRVLTKEQWRDELISAKNQQMNN